MPTPVVPDAAYSALGEWSNMIWSYLNFALQFRRVLELAKIRLDIIHLKREKVKAEHANSDPEDLKKALREYLPSENGVSMTMLPDLSYDLLGVEGIVPLNIDFNDEMLRNPAGDSQNGQGKTRQTHKMVADIRRCDQKSRGSIEFHDCDTRYAGRDSREKAFDTRES